MIDLLTFLCALTGSAMMLLSQHRHQQDWLRRKLPPVRSRRLRIGGFTMLAAALIIADSSHGWAYGLLVWCGLMTLAAIFVVAINTNRERIMRKVRP